MKGTGNKQMWDQIFPNIPEVVMVQHRDGIIDYTNRDFRGRSSAELIGLPYNLVVPEEVYRDTKQALEDACDNSRTAQIDVRMDDEHGECDETHQDP